MEFRVAVADWFTIDEAGFREQVFAASKWALPGEDVTIWLELPVYDAVRAAIEAGFDRQPLDVAAEQRYELDRAAERLDRLARVAGVFLHRLMSYYGGRAAATGCAQLLRLGAAEVAGRLACFQTWDSAARDDFATWYDIDESYFSVCRAVFGGGQLVSESVGSEEWDVWLPRATGLDDLIWVRYVLPQCGLQRVLGTALEVPWLAPDAPENARVCLNAITDPPTARVGPYIFPAPGTSVEFLGRRVSRCLREVTQAGPGEWRAPSIWHAVLWLRDLAAWNQLGRPRQAGLTEVFGDAAPGAFLFRGQRDARWPLQPSLLRVSGADAGPRALATLRFALANMHLQSQGEISPALADAFVGAAQHYGLPTSYLDFTVDPLSAAFFASDNAVDGDEAAIYWLATEEALRHGGKLILAPFWVERLYAQLGCFLDLGELPNWPNVGDPLSDRCYRIVFPASRELAESEYGNVAGSIYPESEWVKAAVEWALNSTTPMDDGPLLARELMAAAGTPPWVGGSMIPANHLRTFTFFSRLVEWTALRLTGGDGAERRFSVDNRAMEVLFGHNPGVYRDLDQIMKLIKQAGFPLRVKQRGAEITDEPGMQAVILWLSEWQDAEREAGLSSGSQSGSPR